MLCLAKYDEMKYCDTIYTNPKKKTPYVVTYKKQSFMQAWLSIGNLYLKQDWTGIK